MRPHQSNRTPPSEYAALVALAAAVVVAVVMGVMTVRALITPAQEVSLPPGVRLIATNTLTAVSASVTPTAISTPSPSPSDPVEATQAQTAEGEAVRAVMSSVVQVRANESLGTGFLVRQEDGRSFFVTNEHVVQGAEAVSVVAPDGTMHDAWVTAADPTLDLALLVVEGVSGMSPVRWGDVGDLRAGDPLYVIGFALGDELLGDPTVTRGVLSGRRMYGQVDYIQTDAAMNPGNSGGPVVSGSGEVVGVATWIIRELGGLPIEGINFAIPADVALAFIDRSV